jgi:IS30 family transposase
MQTSKRSQQLSIDLNDRPGKKHGYKTSVRLMVEHIDAIAA